MPGPTLQDLIEDVRAYYAANCPGRQPLELIVRHDGVGGPGSLMHPITPFAGASHNDDFSSVHWFGAHYDFTPTQRAAVKLLWEVWEAEEDGMSGASILAEIESNAESLRIVFRGSDAWDSMIRPVKKGVYALCKP